MKLLDRYIMKKFLGTFFFSLMLIIMIVIVFDISEKIDDFLEKKAPLQAIIFDYYFNFIPYFINLFSPLFTFISVIFFTAKMAGNTEIVAILSSGVSFRRLLYPYMLSSLVIATISFLLSGWIIPIANKNRIAFEERYIKNPYRYEGRNIHRQVVPGTFIYLESYNNIDHMGYRFSLEKIKEGNLIYKMNADYIRWDSVSGKWQVNSYFERTINGAYETLHSGTIKDTLLPFNPDQFEKRVNTIETMTSGQLGDFIDQEILHGSEIINFYLIEKYRRVSLPFATFILTLIGVSLSSRKVRGGIGLQIGAGIGLSFTYIMFMQVSTTFSTAGGFSPFIAVWIPNVIFLGIAMLLVRFMPR